MTPSCHKVERGPGTKEGARTVLPGPENQDYECSEIYRFAMQQIQGGEESRYQPRREGCSEQTPQEGPGRPREIRSVSPTKCPPC